MKVYYEKREFAPGKHRIITVNYDRDDPFWKNTINVPYSVLQYDEIPANKDNIIALAKSLNRLDARAEARFYVDNTPQIVEKQGWTELVAEDEIG